MAATGEAAACARLAGLGRAITACRVCVETPLGRPLPHEPRPVVRLSATARLCIAGQAPGTRVHGSGVPFSDPSGARLRAWLGIGPDLFYDTARVAIVPMGFCFPGHDAHGGDLPPRRECARTWHDSVFAAMPQLALVLAIGAAAQRYHLKGDCRASVSDTVAAWQTLLRRPGAPRVWPLPHPSWRNNGWLRRHPWFEAELLPALRAEVQNLLLGGR
ncbi:uracil-DNA glycosylase family protein [Pseudoxanthobacter sp.]|uniref:uracil-DNA glycosylase family protein n=1 Tax=Pseudoxanthobacter sp. TaxID=1925742 RepID=UPI002FE2DDBF